MFELKFSVYGDQASPLEEHAFLLREFMQRANCSVKVERLSWEVAWPKLLGFALYGGGPHISQIGSIWTSTLMSMNVLRPFSAREIGSLGGVRAFFPAVWQNAILTEESGAWAVPLNAYIYLVFYRRDLLERAGVDENIAFSSPAAMLETIERLKSKGIHSPIVLPSGDPYRSRIHMIASWIWGAGGDFVASDGSKIRFAEPEALAGMEEFFKLYRYLDREDQNLTYDKCGIAFASGDAAVTIRGSTTGPLLSQWDNPQVLNHLGVAMVPGIPWVGGANLVIWKEAQMHLEAERAALALVNYLGTAASQVKLAQAENRIPPRVDAMQDFQPQYAAFKPIIHQSLLNGRSYHPVSHWVRIMSELRNAFDAITSEVISSPTLEIKEILASKLAPLAKRFSLMLSK